MSERKQKNKKPMSERAVKRLEERAQPFLESGEQVELGVYGRPYSFGNFVLNALQPWAATRLVLLTDHNIHILKCGVWSTRPHAVLAKHPRGSVPVTCKAFPAMLAVGEQRINPNPYGGSFVYAKWIAKHAGGPSAEDNGSPKPGVETRV